MIKISTQRNDNKENSDLVNYTKDSIILNSQEFTFPVGKDLLFESPHEQILRPTRDDKGVLHATILKQYTGKDKMHYEGEDRKKILTDEDMQIDKSLPVIMVRIKTISEDEAIQKELKEVEAEIKTMEDEALKSLIQSRLNEEI